MKNYLTTWFSRHSDQLKIWNLEQSSRIKLWATYQSSLIGTTWIQQEIFLLMINRIEWFMKIWSKNKKDRKKLIVGSFCAFI